MLNMFTLPQCEQIEGGGEKMLIKYYYTIQ